MKSLRGVIALLAVLVAVAVQAQVDSTWQIMGTFDRFTTDELGNVYALKGDELLLYTPHGERIARNSVKTLGEISSIDAFSSLKPMVFARGQGMLAVLDNTLSVQGDPISLPRNGFPQVTLVCMSVQNRFWFFDERLMQLSRVDAQLRPVSTTGRLDQLLGYFPHPAGMQEQDGWLYVNDPENGVHVFDLFGGFSRTLPIVGATSFEVRAGTVLYVKDGVLQAYDLKTFDVQLPVTWLLDKDLPRPIDVRSERGLLYALYPDRIRIAPVAHR